MVSTSLTLMSTSDSNINGPTRIPWSRRSGFRGWAFISLHSGFYEVIGPSLDKAQSDPTSLLLLPSPLPSDGTFPGTLSDTRRWVMQTHTFPAIRYKEFRVYPIYTYDLSLTHIHSDSIFDHMLHARLWLVPCRGHAKLLPSSSSWSTAGETDLPPGKHIVSQASWKPCVTHQQESAGLDSNSCDLHLAKAQWLLPRTVGSFLASLSWAPKIFFLKHTLVEEWITEH